MAGVAGVAGVAGTTTSAIGSGSRVAAWPQVGASSFLSQAASPAPPTFCARGDGRDSGGGGTRRHVEL